MSINYQISELLFQNLIYIKKLGEGQFGKVFLVKDQTSKSFFALKCISKKKPYYENIKDLIEVLIMIFFNIHNSKARKKIIRND